MVYSKVKEMRREAIHWERQIGKFNKTGKFIVFQGKIFSFKECKERHIEAIREWREEVAKVRTSSEKYKYLNVAGGISDYTKNLQV